MAKITFEQFIAEAFEKGAEVRLVPRMREGKMIFYAHLNGVNGSSVDYLVEGDVLTNEWKEPPHA